MKNKKKQNITILISVLAGACLIGAAVTALAVLRQKNPLATGLENLVEEVTAEEAELGEYFWTDIVNQIGSGNMQAEYSFDIGGVPELQNITVGLDGEVKRDMDGQLFEMDMQVSVTNLKLAEIFMSGTPETLFVQVPSIWDGSVVVDAENVSGQWNDSAVREQIQNLTGMELGIGRRIDARMMESFSAEPFSAAGFFRENEDALKSLYENMEVMKTAKAVKEGKLSEKQAETLEEYVLEDAEGSQIETACYLAVLPRRELGEIFQNVASDIRLAVYLDQQKRIVRIAVLPEEILVTDIGEVQIGLNMTGAEHTIDRLELAVLGTADADNVTAELWSGGIGTLGIESSFVIEKEADRAGSYDIEGRIALSDQDHAWEITADGSISGEQAGAGRKLSLDVKNLTCRGSGQVLCRLSGNAVVEPLEGSIDLPSGKEYPIGEMNEMETMLFLAECMGNIYENYGGYLKLLQ